MTFIDIARPSAIRPAWLDLAGHQRLFDNAAEMPNEHPEPEPRADRGWTPHLWAIVVPLGAVVIAYVLWFGLMAVLSLPDWLARMR
jgi:hypothetical protein